MPAPNAAPRPEPIAAPPAGTWAVVVDVLAEFGRRWQLLETASDCQPTTPATAGADAPTPTPEGATDEQPL